MKDKEKSQSRLAPIDEDRRLIEEYMPIKEISFISAKEKQGVRGGHIAGLHRWWARRPLAECRAVIYSALVILPLNQGDKDALTKDIISFAEWKNSMNISMINKARNRIHNDRGIEVNLLDPFAGGGAIPLEALRLGCNSYSVDINPIAHIIQKCELEFPVRYGSKEFYKKNKFNLISDLEKYGKKFYNIYFEKIKLNYCSEGNEVPIVYFWAKQITCSNPQCRKQVPLLRSFIIVNKSKKKIAIKPIINNDQLNFVIQRDKQIDFDSSKGFVKRDNLECPFCNQVTDGKYIREISCANKLDERLIAVCYSDNNIKTKNYRLPTQRELLIINKIKLDISKISHELPNEDLPYLRSIFNVHVYGIKKWKDLFNPRQQHLILSLIKSLQEIKGILKTEINNGEYEKAIITYLTLATGKIIDYSSANCLWQPNLEAVTPTFGRQALPFLGDYVEVNPLDGPIANWKSIIENTRDVISHCSFMQEKEGIAIRTSATTLPFKESFFDAIITDPPYYDAVPYSELSDFFYIWYKIILKEFYPQDFLTPLTPKGSEIVQHRNRHGSQEESKIFFETELTHAFNECNRVLKIRGIFVVVFAHKSTSAWETLVSSLLNANFIVTASWPFNTEMKTRLRGKGSAALASSIFIVCRKRESEEEGYLNEVKIELKERISKKLDQFWSQGIRGADFFISAIGPAVEVFGKYKKVKKLSGEEVSVAELLDIVRQIVTDYSLHQILHDGTLANIDDATRFYVLWRWSYADADVPFDDARKLAQALGSEPDELLSKKGLLTKKGDKVNMLEPWERKDEHLGEPKNGIPAPMIDVIHKACILWEKGNKKALTDFIEKSGYAKEESLWNIAQAISEILPEGSKEKQLLQGLLNTKTTVQKEEFNKQTGLNSYMGDKK